VSDCGLFIDDKFHRKGATIIYDPQNPECTLACLTREGMLWVWSVWDYRPQGVRAVLSQRMYSGMLVEELPTGFRYRCNEGRDDDDYDDLIFRIERIDFYRPSQKRPPTRTDRQLG